MSIDRLNDVSIASRGTTEIALARANAQAADKKDGAVGKRFEELLGSMLVKEMRSTLHEGFFGETTGSDTFDSWIDEHVGKLIAERGQFGLAAPIKAEAERLARRGENADVAAVPGADAVASTSAPLNGSTQAAACADTTSLARRAPSAIVERDSSAGLDASSNAMSADTKDEGATR